MRRRRRGYVALTDLVVTGASRGLGRAFVEAVRAARPGAYRFVLSARPGPALDEVVAGLRDKGAEVVAIPADLADVREARSLGRQLADRVSPGAIGVANAGLWPTVRVVGPEGLEAAFVVNAVSLRPVWEPLLRAGHLARLLGVGAGLQALGRFDAARTPTGDDFGRFATYCRTKLAGACVLRDLAAEHPAVDVLVCHPGVVDTGLGAADGWFGRWLRAVKRLAFERPERAGARLERILAVPTWSTPGVAAWWEEEKVAKWPANAEDPGTRAAVRATVAAALAGIGD